MSQRRIEARIYKAPPHLQAKVGRGRLDPKTILRCQEIIDKNTFDFVPLASGQLEEFRAMIDAARAARDPDEIETIKSRMTQIVMQLKGHAGLFHYPLVSRLGAIMLFFLDNVDNLDDDVLDIARAHYRTLAMILELRIKDSDDRLGRDFERELKSACGRYFARMKIKPEDDAFYVEF
ncbi:MAG: hypothetical protein EOM26_09340 [Alphaproteobacteria bacterium]|nr:hypothetical protein [Alphaproteobacteria bacterium]